MQLLKISPDVYRVTRGIVSIGLEDIDFLKSKVSVSSKGRVRINLHKCDSDLLHEMIIVINGGSYIRPHLHINKSESFHIIYGQVDIVFFDSNGGVRDVISLDAADPLKAFCCRMSEPVFHTLVVKSDIVVMHEITNGPFSPGGSVMANFAPVEGDFDSIKKWTKSLKKSLGI